MDARYDIEPRPRRRRDGTWQARARLFVYTAGGPPVQHAVEDPQSRYPDARQADAASRHLAEEYYRRHHGGA